MPPQAHPTLLGRFLAWVAEMPHATALVEGRAIMSYAGLEAASRRAATAFRAAGWTDGQVVACCLTGAPTLTRIVVMLGLMRAGAVQVLFSDHELSAEFGPEHLRRCGAAGLLTDLTLDWQPGVTVLAPDAGWLSAGTASRPQELVVPGPERTWTIARSSGTTGAPKAFAITHGQEAARADAQAKVLLMTTQDRLMVSNGFGFPSSLSYGLRCLAVGGTIVGMPGDRSATATLAAIDRFAVTYLCCPPSDIHQLMAVLPPRGLRLPRLRMMRVGSAMLSPALLEGVRQRLTRNLHHTYGANEVGSIACATPEMLAAEPNCVGRPADGVELELRGPDGSPVPRGEPGRVWVRSPGQVAGYLDAAEADRQRFRDGWYDTADMAVLTPDGLLVLKGRADEILNFGGMLVSLREIELAFDDHPAVDQVAAFSLPSDIQQDSPAAAIVLKSPATTEELLKHARRKLGVKTPPAVFLTRTLPRNAAGKVLRSELRRQALEVLANRRAKT
jgi:acyl-coenzyme A synthetase/AMP-(fatty) acid ligase